jgi:hypothetical protein
MKKQETGVVFYFLRLDNDRLAKLLGKGFKKYIQS